MKGKPTLTPSEIAAALGSIKTDKKIAASAANLKRAHEAKREQRKKLSETECTCDGGRSTVRTDHKGSCPMWRAINYREKKGLPLE